MPVTVLLKGLLPGKGQLGKVEGNGSKGIGDAEDMYEL